MAHLFTVQNSIVRPNTETLLIPPYKEIWERDTSKDKHDAIMEYTYIEFMISKNKSNPYAGYGDEERHEKLKKIYFTEDWEPDTLVKKGMEELHEFQIRASVTYRYYIATVEAIEKMRTFFVTFDIMETNEKGALLYKPSDITRAINDTDKILQNLMAMKGRVEQELFEQTKTKGNKQINHFEI